MGHAVVFLNYNRVKRLILERDSFALAAVDDDLLRGRLLHLEAGSGGHLCDRVLTGVHLFPLLMELDLPIGVREDIAEVDGAGGVGGFPIAGIGHMELGPLNGSARHAVLLEDGQLRGLVVFEHDGFLVARVQTDRLLPVGVLAGEVVGRGDGLLCDAVAAGDNPQGNRTVRAGSHIVLIVAVNALNGEHRARNNGVRVSVNFGDGQKGLLEVVKNQFPILSGAEVNGLRGFICHHIGVGDRFLNHFIAVHGDV